jgi:O-antigen/teichoic acid export membrane protein
MVLMALSGPMISTLYGEKYVYGPFFLTLAVAGNLFAVFGSLSSNGFLSGLGETRMLMKQSILTIAFGLPLGFLIIPTLGITGLIIANTLAGVPGFFWIIYWIWKHYKAKADFQSSAKILAASTIAAFVAYLPIVLLNTANWIKLTVGGIIFLATYITTAPLIGAISQNDIKNLKAMFSGLGIISKVMIIPLVLAERVTNLRFFRKD